MNVYQVACHDTAISYLIFAFSTNSFAIEFGIRKGLPEFFIFFTGVLGFSRLLAGILLFDLPHPIRLSRIAESLPIRLALLVFFI